MATGYTADIVNDQSFEDYVLGCARAFGACLHQRDNDPAEKPKLQETDPYYANRIEETEQQLNTFNRMNHKDQVDWGQTEKSRQLHSINESLDKKDTLLIKYLAMLDKVNSWIPPSKDYVEFKKFMASQIEDSINWDCSTKYYTDEYSRIKDMIPRDFYNARISRLNKDLLYYKEQLHKEEIRTLERNFWIKSLYESLGFIV